MKSFSIILTLTLYILLQIVQPILLLYALPKVHPLENQRHTKSFEENELMLFEEQFRQGNPKL